MDATVREKYMKAGSVAGRARDYGATLVQEGAKLLDVATEVEAFIIKEGALPAFPCCISLNEDAAHYSPKVEDDSVFKRGDLVKLDCGAHVDGYIGDTARTIEVGSQAQRDLTEPVQAALDKALGIVKAGLPIRTVSETVEATLRGAGLVPVANLTGHSVDHYHQHAGLSVPSVAATAHGDFPDGTAVAIEPFATRGVGKVKDSGPGHIWHLRNPRPQRDAMAKKALAFIVENHPDLPFSERWLQAAVPEKKIPYALRVLERTGAVSQYPILREAGDGLVAQFEHTVIIEPDGCTITTRGA